MIECRGGRVDGVLDVATDMIYLILALRKKQHILKIFKGVYHHRGRRLLRCGKGRIGRRG